MTATQEHFYEDYRPRRFEAEDAYEREAMGDELSLADLLATILEAKWLIIAIVALSLVVGVTMVWRAAPVYRAHAMLKVEQEKPGLTGLGEMAEFMVQETPVPAEIELLKSLQVLTEVVEELQLNLHASPHHFPFIGEPVARRHGGDNLADPLFGLHHYAWGGEQIDVRRFQVPEALLGKPFSLVALDNNRYQLLDPEGQSILKGQVGQVSAAQLAADDTALKLLVSELKARPGTYFNLSSQAVLRSANALRSRLNVSEKGKGSGVLQVSLEGKEPQRLQAIVNNVANVYIRRNVERKSEEAQKTLSFIEKQLPAVKEQMEAAERALNDYRHERGSIDLSGETAGILNKILKVESELADLRRKQKEMKQSFTDRHPRMISIQAKMDDLKSQLDALNQEVKQLPDTQQEILRLQRDAEVNAELYTFLLNKAQELRVVKAGTVPNVHVVDYAYLPYAPVAPSKSLILALSVLLGGFVGVGLAFARKALKHGIEDPEKIERELALPVYATVPHSKMQARMEKNKRGRSRSLLAVQSPNDLAIESLRSLRTSLHFSMAQASRPILMITGPTPRVGKSFITANLAAVLSAGGHARALVIDADLRRGHLHDYFGVARKPGLSEIITGDCSIEEVIHSSSIAPGVDFVPAGTRLPNPSEQLLHKRFEGFLNHASKSYDLVLIDTPPILMVTEAAIIGRLAGMSLLVMKDSAHPMREIEESIKRLQQAGVSLRGAIFNNMKAASRRYGYGRYYGYKYSYSYEPEKERAPA